MTQPSSSSKWNPLAVVLLISSAFFAFFLIVSGALYMMRPNSAPAEAGAKKSMAATLFGSGSVGIIEMNSAYRRPCYFFQNSDFHRHATFLDGAVAAHLDQEGNVSARFCPNPLSPRAKGLRQTQFAKLFGTAVENPRAAERSGLAYVLQSDTDRRDEAALLRELQAKYKTEPLQVMHLGYHHFAAQGPDVV